MTVRSWNRPLLALTGAMVLLALVCVGGLLLDPRVLGGQPIWAKPLKFSVSLAVYSPTLAWMVSLVRGDRAHRVASSAATVVALAGAIEMVAIVGQVIRGRASHFDVATPFDTAVWGVMAVSIVVLWLANLVIAVMLLRERSLTPSIAWGVRLGLAVSLLGMAVAFLMTSPTGAQIQAAKATGALPVSGAHAVGVPDGGPGLAFLGWSTTGGDLRIGHFVGLHGLQVVPLVALGLLVLAARVPRLRSELVRTRLVLVAAAAWTGLTLLLTWQALRAQPLLAPDALTLAVAGGLVVGTALAVVLVLARAPRPAPREAVAA
ncbi:hypothetical protein [Actinomycetospora sp. NBRC 106378]|uniref:hypothetical protein n=1 Tax=Actinomycetospora sp. NBRC 106378 TaxID=3032208 RepID=UPI002555E8B2|nr:hypothetical protein [Actinomycetospora sp. NBRC 106378]